MGLSDIFKISEYKAEIERLKEENQNLVQQINKQSEECSKLNEILNDLGYDKYTQLQQKIQELQDKYNAQQEQFDRTIKTNEEVLKNSQIKFENSVKSNEEIIRDLESRIEDLQEEKIRADKRLKTTINKINRSKELYKSIDFAITTVFSHEPELRFIALDDDELGEIEEFSPSVILKLHHMDIKSLNKAFKDNNKQIENIMMQYKERYTTKTNRALYEVMVIALKAELQNILYNLKYDKLENAINQVKEISAKYWKIAAEGNQSIAGTLTKFIGEIEYFFINAVKIEYNYYVKKEQARQEQLAIREQMRQEAEERKALEQEKKKVEKEEQKYKNEIDKVKAQLSSANSDETAILNAKILELESKLLEVNQKRESITALQNGKAGNVYIISNLGSFGDNVFKIGMTRRLDPLDRINELGSASVPFKFDVHSFIFSEDAVDLETKLHHMLNDKRVNKVNMRKEFFYSTVDELETLVHQIDPTAEFNKTMIAEEYNQSLSSNEVYTSELSESELSDDDD